MSWLDAAGPASSSACIPELESRWPLLSSIRQSGSSHVEFGNIRLHVLTLISNTDIR